MAHDIVIAGGGFAGANAARELEKVLPRQSTRLILVNDVNFLLYTPLLPEAAAGTLEPRHVVTPLRDILKRTYLRLGAVTGHDPDRHVVELTTHEGETEELHYDQLLVALGSVSRSLPIPGLDKHAIGFKSLADAIWLRNHMVETLEEANASEDPQHRAELLTYVFVGGGYAGLEALAELQDFAADAMENYPRARLQGMRWILVEAADRVLPGDRSVARRLRPPGAARPRHRHPPEHPARGGRPAPHRPLDRRADPDPHGRLDRGGRRASEHEGDGLRARRARSRRRRRPHGGARHGRRVRRGRLRRRPEPRGRALPTDRPARHPPGTGGRAQHGRQRRRRLARRHSPTAAAAPS